MKPIATKVSEDLAKRVRSSAVIGKTTVSALVRKAVETDIDGHHGATFGSKFGHLFGAGKRLPADTSRKEGY